MRFRFNTPAENVLELAHDERLREEEFAYVDRVLGQFSVVKEIMDREAAELPWYLQVGSPSAIGTLINTSYSYPEAVPVLMTLLTQVRHPEVKAYIARALTVKEARGLANRTLIEVLKQVPWSAELRQEYLTLSKQAPPGEFDRLPAEVQHRIRTLARWDHLLFALGNALAYVAQRDDLPHLLEFVRDPRYGAARTEILRAVIRFRPEGLRELLLELLKEPDDGLALEAARGLARLKVKEAREAILERFRERMAQRGQGEFRKMVEKVVARLEG